MKLIDYHILTANGKFDFRTKATACYNLMSIGQIISLDLLPDNEMKVLISQCPRRIDTIEDTSGLGYKTVVLLDAFADKIWPEPYHLAPGVGKSITVWRAS